MVKYICIRCEYQTSQRSHFKNHLLRKNICKYKINNISEEQMISYYTNDFPEIKNRYANDNTTKFTQINSNEPQFNTKKELKCEYCNKLFSRNDSLQRHMKNSCKHKNDKLDLYNKIETLINEISLIKEENKKLKEELKVSKNVINSHNTIKNNKIQINNYGKENIDYITDKVFMKLLSTPLAAIPKLIELKHFNPKHPENHNIKITNIHDKFAKIYKDNKWLISHKKNVIQDLVENGYADFEEFKDLNEEELTTKIKEKYKIMEQYFIKNPEKLCQKSEVMIINGTSKDIVI